MILFEPNQYNVLGVMAAYHGSLSFSLQTVKVLFPKAILKFLDT